MDVMKKKNNSNQLNQLTIYNNDFNDNILFINAYTRVYNCRAFTWLRVWIFQYPRIQIYHEHFCMGHTNFTHIIYDKMK